MEPSEHEKDKVERLRRAMYSRSLSPKIHDRERRSLGQEQSGVGEDFVPSQEETAGSVVAPRAIGFARKALWWLLGAAVIFFIGAIGFFSYYFLLGGGSFSASPGNIAISISGPPQIEGGAPTELQIVVANRNKVPLELADLVVTYPRGTRSLTDFATDLQNQRIPLGTIEAGGTRQGTVSAVFAGNEGDHADVKVELEYRISGSSAIFAASADYSIVFSSSPLSLVISGNNETISGQPVEFTVDIASNANAPVRDVLLSAQYPFGFKFSSADPAPSTTASSGQSGVWKIGDISPGQKRTLTLRGVLSGEQGDDRVFHFTAGTRKDATATSSVIEMPLADNIFTVSISKPFLGLAISVGGASGSNIIVSPGDNVSVSIDWKNNLPTAITDAVIVAKLSGFPIDGATVHTTDGFYRSNDDVVIWDKTTSGGALANLLPGARGKVAFSFQMPKSEELKNIINPRLDISVNAAGKRTSETGVPQNLQATAKQRISLASDLSLTAQGLYYSNPFGSVGPMPPKAGTETTYAIVFTVTNTTNKITDAKVTAHLPPYVRYVGICSPRIECDPDTQKLTFNQEDGTLTWNMGDIEPGVGLNGTPPRQIAIAIGFTPSTSQIGQQPSLLQSIQLSGLDPLKVAAMKAVNLTAQILPTVLKTDSDVTTNLQQVAKTSKDAATGGTDPGFSAANATVIK
ncbi:hypothetical protein EXS56_01915 [Candidatus Kaiserbacteria bacterium]|nr:hypothetical protein [Candidatus Kaiserbacteria bacterium]